MNLRILYFALLRDAVGMAEESPEVPDTVTTVGDLREWLRTRGEPWVTALGNTRRIRAAVNQEMADPEDPIKDGDEVAFFPPVTGG